MTSTRKPRLFQRIRRQPTAEFHHPSIKPNEHPHLIGTISHSDGKYTISGTWQYGSDISQSFELHSVSLDASGLSGEYYGSFQNRMANEVVVEKNVSVQLTEKVGHEIRGSGNNKYGSFHLVGIVTGIQDGSLEGCEVSMYKVYDFTEAYSQFETVSVSKMTVRHGRRHSDSALQNMEEGELPPDPHLERRHSASNVHHKRTKDHMTRVDGKGLWRSWKRNFNSQFTAILDLVDNSLDASIEGLNRLFVGRCHINPDTYNDRHLTKKTTTGIIITNNSIKKMRPLQNCLEVYDSSKVDSGADHVGENGVGLKQACATLSDLSFVLVKNGTNRKCELGIIAEQLQSTEGVYLPAFPFSNDTNDANKPTLAQQMKDLFSDPKHADVAHCIAQYGAALNGSGPSLEVGISRICKHFDTICQFHDSNYVFAVIVDKVRSNNDNAMTAIRVNDLLDELTMKIPRTYLHVPRTFDFQIKGRDIDFTFWHQRLVEFSQFSIKVPSTVPFDEPRDDPQKCTIRVYTGFDSQAMIEPKASKYAALYVYSRQSGRLITQHNDARTLLSLSAGGTEFCSGLRIIIDDYEGHLPLNPTKQDVAFSEKTHGDIFKINLFKSVGAVAHMYYKLHINKYGGKKTVLSKKVADYGERMAKEKMLESELVNLNLSTIKHSKFKTVKHYLRLDVEREVAGSDTLYRLMPAVRERTTSKNVLRVRAKSRPGSLNAGRMSSQLKPSESENEVESEEEYGNESSSSEDEEWGRESKPKAQRGRKRKAQGDSFRRRRPVRQNSNKNETQNERSDSGRESEVEEADKNMDKDEPVCLPFLNHDSPQLLPPTSPLQHETHVKPPVFSTTALPGTTPSGGFSGLFPEDDTDDEGSLKEEIKMQKMLIAELTIKLEERKRTLAEREREVTDLKYQNSLLVNNLAECNTEIADLQKQLQHFTPG